MPENAERFTGRVAEYEQYRERYDPAVVLPLLRSWCGLTPEWLVADVGAGTGMLSDVFLANGNRVIAVEPNAEMREACARVHRDDALLKTVKGTAEAMGLEKTSVEMVSVGRALHWFDLERALVEFRRVLKPRGWVAVISIGRTEKGREENEAFEELLTRFTSERKGTRARYSVYGSLRESFAGGEFHHEETRSPIEMQWEELRGMAMSISHAPLKSDVRFPEFEGMLREFFDRFAVAGAISLETRCWVNAGRFAE